MTSFVAVLYIDGFEKDSFFLNVPRGETLADYMQRKYHVSYADYVETKDTYLGVGIACTWVFESGNIVYRLTDYRF